MKHSITRCKQTNYWYHGKTTRRGGQWILEFTCPDCKRVGKFLRNYLGSRTVMCDGQFSKLTPEQLSAIPKDVAASA
jgi:phage FluMu protein Com